MKRLSIIIPTYNMEALLGRCLDSIVASPAIDQIEVVVVNDGSRDGSLAIAQGYEARFPQSVRVVDKPNGNYGSTINAALPLLQGEWVKILDADDRFDVALVEQFVEALGRAEGADMMLTPYIEERHEGLRRVDCDIYSRNRYEYGRIYDAERLFADGVVRLIAMHSVAYRTALLREMGYRQSEGISYTDQEWVFYPLFGVERIVFADIPLYIYNLTREGQTMDPRVMLRSLTGLVAVTEAMSAHYASAHTESMSPARRAFLQEALRCRHRVVYRLWLLAMPDEEFSSAEFEASDQRMVELAKLCGLGRVAVPVNNVLGFDLLDRWRRCGRRYPSWVRSLLRWADNAMIRLHALVFGRKG